MTDLNTLTIEKALISMSSGELTSRNLVSAYLEQIKKVDTDVRAYLEVFEDALAQADEADLKRKTVTQENC